jgi:hypothetical protein
MIDKTRPNIALVHGSQEDADYLPLDNNYPYDFVLNNYMV